MNRVLELNDDFDDARLRRAELMLRLRRPDEALQDYEILIAKHPDHPLAYTGRAWANQMKGDADAVQADIDRLAEIAPEKAHETAIQSLHGKVVWLESQERYDEAIEVAEEIIAMASDEPIGYRLRGWIRWYTEQHVEACEDYTRLLEITPGEADLLNARGQIFAEMGEWDSAMDDLNIAIEKSRESGLHHLLAFALNGRAFALAGLDRMGESNRDYDESVRLCPDNSWVYYNRGLVLYQRGDHRKARDLLRKSLEMKEPPLTKRKRERAQFALDRLNADSSQSE
jgi:tetratricopeptide (TPR) repeat protein